MANDRNRRDGRRERGNRQRNDDPETRRDADTDGRRIDDVGDDRARGGRTAYDANESDRSGRDGGRRYATRRPGGGTRSGTPEGSQRGSHRERGLAGRLGGQRGGEYSHESEQRDEPHEGRRFGGRRGGSDRDRRYGSRRGHGTRRREPPERDDRHH